MASIVETTHPAAFLVSEANKTRSREKVTVLSGQNLKSGHVVGKATKAGTVTTTVGPGNTGDGTMGSVTVGADSKVGKYILTIIEPETNKGMFIVEDPDGVNVGQGDVASAFSGGGLSFTLADGSTDFASGDTFTLEVDAGTGKVVEHDPVATNGAEVAAGVLLEAVDATSADKAGVLVVRDAEVNAAELVFKDAMSTPDKDKAKADMELNGVIAL